jgi:predicted signal transduction protein with EAL and GGDEF domain
MAGVGVQCWLQDLSSDLRLEEVLDRTIENALRACPDREFALFTPVEGELTLARTSGLDTDSRRRVAVWVHLCANALNRPLDVEHPREMGGAMRALPLVFNGQFHGVLVALARSGDPFDDRERDVLDAFAEQAALALSNAQLFQALLQSATHDELTELPNRREFDRLLQRELDRSRRYGSTFSLAILDLDESRSSTTRAGTRPATSFCAKRPI